MSLFVKIKNQESYVWLYLFLIVPICEIPDQERTTKHHWETKCQQSAGHTQLPPRHGPRITQDSHLCLSRHCYIPQICGLVPRQSKPQMLGVHFLGKAESLCKSQRNSGTLRTVNKAWCSWFLSRTPHHVGILINHINYETTVLAIRHIWVWAGYDLLLRSYY